ncbi:FdhF/YdeP family oxidoreductase [Roseibacillus ishigakijimensis]|uniref:FdhF/YdeP family oxidoreductase n=1 Tax=Roseibacillus ishigakijimensis TaxID=454146 RepID=A0A934RTG3_9BACT|nr:FdhF/YdeP family oxidoreductase [Roseibacillus ishigakijimensis]MBK1833865.1 FdhF/YdeP family oxidoreductase [Roseibacillus ishigakijimensis]
MKSAPETLPDAEPPRELSDLHRSEPKAHAVGSAAVISSLAQIHAHTDPVRGTKALTKLNQKDGFDCPSCAWADPDGKRSMAEFCENGAKAVATEITNRRVDREFFATHSLLDLGKKSDYWLNDAGRITEPFLLDEGASHYRPVSWEEAFAVLAEELNACEHPDEAIFYTSGRASNEAAFVYQLFVRQFGTNNLPDCSNMCHESSGSALSETIGIGKGTVTLEDLETTDCVLVVGQNPGTNHPRMLTSLEQTVKNGGQIISVNPLRETGLRAFAHPQKVSGMLGKATPLSSLHLPVKLNGDLALFKGLIKCAFEAEAKNPGTVVDENFVRTHSAGFEEFQAAAEKVEWAELVDQSGLSEEQIRQAAAIFLQAENAITCWAMGLTQHHNSVEIIREVVNLHLLTGKIGRPKSGLCPVRGHSNVQGDRTMGIWEKSPESFLARLDQEFAFTSPRKHGYDTVEAIRAMHAGEGRVFFALGGNFLSAAPDTHYTACALRRCQLTAHVSTKLNRSHLVTGKRALILPCLGRSEIDHQATGPQMVSVENSMGVVSSSRGALEPASPHLLSEPAIICRLAAATLGERSQVPWQAFEKDYDQIRERIARVIPGFEDFNNKLRQPGGFYLPNAVKKRVFNTATGKANFTVNPLRPLALEDGQLLLQTFRSHDQFNTTVYGLDDRYRGIKNERRVIFLNPEDMKERGLEAEEAVDITSHFEGESRTAKLFLAIPYETPRGTAAAYYPEANVLVPINSTAATSQTPTSKSVIITLHKRD